MLEDFRFLVKKSTGGRTHPLGTLYIWGFTWLATMVDSNSLSPREET